MMESVQPEEAFQGRDACTDTCFDELTLEQKRASWAGHQADTPTPWSSGEPLFKIREGEDLDVTGKKKKNYPGEKEGGTSWAENCFGEESQEKKGS